MERKRPTEEIKFKTVELPDREMEAVMNNILDKTKFLSREDAARMFLEIADLGQSGHWPQEVTPWAVGRSLLRLMSNNGAPDDYNLAELERGFKGENSQPLIIEDEEEPGDNFGNR